MKLKLSILCVFIAVAMSFSGCGKDDIDTEPMTDLETESEAEIKVDPEIADILNTKHTLRVGEDGEFRVLVISDVQSTGDKLDDFIRENIVTLVDREEPDLVLFTGDNTFGMYFESTLRSILNDMTGYIESKGIPWAHVYGNHDDEWNALSKETQQEIYESYEYCVSRTDGEDIYGVGNYVLPVLSSDGDDVAFNIFAFDSGSYLSEEEQLMLTPNDTTYSGYYGSSYDYIRPSQINWYEETSIKMEEYYGKKIPALAYFHIPLQENYLAWSNREALEYNGEKRESIGASPINSGLFSAMLERGDVKAVVTGHDHMNDYMLNYCGIKLCSAATIGNQFYYEDDMLGGRVFVFNENDPNNIDTYMSYVGEHNGAISTPVEALDAGNVLDFESETVDYDISARSGSIEDYQRAYEIEYNVFEGKGVNGSAAFGATRSAYNEYESQNIIECKLTLDSMGSFGDNRYLRVWMDLRGENTAIDFGRAAIGVVVDKQNGSPHITESVFGSAQIHYLADGSEEWITLNTDENGNIGADAGVSVEGYCGWFAISLDDLYQVGTRDILDPEDRITGFYIYFTLANEDMVGEYVYIDDIALVEDYVNFN